MRGQVFDLDCPPSTLMHVPVTQLARGEARKATTAATSSGVPNLPEGIFSSTNLAILSGFSFWRRSQLPPGKTMDPGATELTRIPFSAASLAKLAVMLIIADLAAL